MRKITSKGSVQCWVRPIKGKAPHQTLWVIMHAPWALAGIACRLAYRRLAYL